MKINSIVLLDERLSIICSKLDCPDCYLSPSDESTGFLICKFISSLIEKGGKRLYSTFEILSHSSIFVNSLTNSYVYHTVYSVFFQLLSKSTV